LSARNDNNNPIPEAKIIQLCSNSGTFYKQAATFQDWLISEKKTTLPHLRQIFFTQVFTPDDSEIKKQKEKQKQNRTSDLTITTMVSILLAKFFVAITLISIIAEECFTRNVQYILGYFVSYVLFRRKVLTPLSESRHMNMVVIEGVCVIPPWVYLVILSIFMRLSFTRGFIHAGISVTMSVTMSGTESYDALDIIGWQMKQVYE
jgi:hypothetical protein